MQTIATQDIELLVTPRPALLPAAGRPGWPLIVAAWLAGFLGQWGSVVLWVPPFQQSTVWLAGGLLLALLLVTESRIWPLIVIAGGAGQALFFLLLDLVTVRSALVLAVELGFVVWLTAWTVQRAARQPIGFGTFRELLHYLAVAVVGGALLASAVFLGGAYFFTYRPVTFLVWRTFALSVVLGYLMLTPAVVLFVRNLPGILSETPSRRLEGLAITLLMVLASAIVFVGGAEHGFFWPVFAILIPPLLLWAALRFGALGAAGSVLLVTLISTFGTAQGLGPFNFESAAENTLSLQLFMLGTGTPLIGLAVILGEQRRTAGILRETHERLRSLNQDLITAREAEGMRIARELHDDVGQRLALVSIGLSHLRRVVQREEVGPLGEISRLQEQTSSIAKSLRQISHDLHPTTLEHAGLSTALQMACEEVARVTRLDVKASFEGNTEDLPRDLALCLFRVAQEGLNNAVRHSGAKSVRILLRRDERGIMLTIIDDGRGFSPGTRRERGGLGLHSVAERVALAGGDFTIDSTPGSGAILRALVPLGEHVRA